MAGYLGRRLAQSLLVLLGLTIFVFVITRLTGDPAALLLSTYASPEDVRRFRESMGLDEPLVAQYGVFLSNALLGDFGTSFQFHIPAMPLVLERVPATVQLAAAAFAFAVVVGVPAGVVSATQRGTIVDNLINTVAIVGLSIPVFWLGIVLIWIFGVALRLLPTGGQGGPENLVLPAVALGTFSAASIARLVRASMGEVLGRDYIRTARAKGLKELRVLRAHALRNAAIPVITIVGYQFGILLGGAVVTEYIFSWPGVGRLAVQAVLARDYPLVQAAVFFVAITLITVNTLVDLTYHAIDPRIRLGSAR